MSFSMENNFRSLTGGTGGNNMNILDGLKFYSTVQVVAGHRFVTLVISMIFNPSFYESEVKSDQLVFMPTLVVDTFFVVSGLLIFTFGYSPLKTHGLKIFPLLIFDRWLRLFGYDLEKRDVPCAPHLWYLACDLQMFPVGVLIVYMFARSHSLGLKFALATFATSLAIPFSIIYFNHYDGVFRIDPNRYPDGFNVDHMAHIYIHSYTRAGPYIMSIIAGFLLMKIQQNQWTLSVPMRWFVLLLSIVIGQGSQYYGFVFYDPNREYNALENALFGALHRSLWAVMICTIIVIQLAWGFGGNIDRLLTHPIYVPLSRLAYLVYLFHPIWQMITAANSRSPVYLSVWRIGWMVGGDLAVVYLGSLWLYFIIEGPANKIRASLMGKMTRAPSVKEDKRDESKKLD